MNPPGLGAPNPNAAGVVPFCPCPGAPKLNGDPVPNPADSEGVTGVNVNEDGLESVVPFVVPGGLETPKEFVAGVGCVVGNALTGAGVIPNALPFASGLGPGLEASCLGATNWKVPVVAEMLGPGDGKETFESDPSAGLLAVDLCSRRSSRGRGEGGVGRVPNIGWGGWLTTKGEGVDWLAAPNGEGKGCD